MEAIRNEENMQQLKKVQKLIIGMGEALLCYGAEISRVEETIQRVADHFQIEEVEMYVITNGLFVNVHQQEEHTSTRLKYVPSISVNMKKLCDINELSRRIEQENLSVDTALKTLEQIRAAKNEPVWELVLSSGVGAAAFGFLFGGSMWDCLTAFVCGVILQMFFSFLEAKHVNISKVLLEIIGGLLVTILCVILQRIGVSEHLELAIAGAIIPMIPGVAFTNGIRDIVDGDYLSGCVRLLDAILVFCSIAIGVGLGLKL